MINPTPTTTLPPVVINGFYYPYCKSLLTKLELLKGEDKLFAKVNMANALEQAKEMSYTSKLSPITAVIMHKICEQLGLGSIGDSARPDQINNLIDVCREFLESVK